MDVIPKVEWELYGDNGVRKRPLGGSGVGSGSTALPDCMSGLCIGSNEALSSGRKTDSKQRKQIGLNFFVF